MNSHELFVAVGHVIRAHRTRLGYSQESFAARIPVHRTYIGSVERGERNVSLNKLIQIAEALEEPLSSLLAQAEREAM